MRIIISRTDSIGDVMLTLPMCVWLKKNIPDATLIFLGRGYTQAIVACFSVVDQFIDWKLIENLPTSQRSEALKELKADAIIHVFPNKEIAALARKARIPMKIGTSHRSFHLLSCSHRLNFSRKNSALHESQLNFELLKPLGLTAIPSMEEVMSMTSAFKVERCALPDNLAGLLEKNNKTVVLHPKSQGSALEWPLESYLKLANELVAKGYTVYFTGTEQEGDLFRSSLPINDNIIDLTGKLSLKELIYFISQVKNLVACSTGPLHIAGFLGVRAIGLFSPRKPIHPGRWQPIGTNVRVLVFDPNCPICKRKKSCQCIQEISVDRVLAEIE
jgi:heptosyltransferase-3